MSLDGGNRLALQAVADMFGVTIDDEATSEDILAMNFLAVRSSFGEDSPDRAIRKRYDSAMTLQYGGQWYAGRRDSKILDTKAYIEQYPKLINEHVREIAHIKKLKGKDFRFSEEYETACYNFLAGLEEAGIYGSTDISLSDAGDRARSEGKEYDKSDCPTGQMTAEEMLAKQGIGEKVWMHCPFCGASQFGDPCATVLTCTECRAKVDHGKVVSTGNGGKKQKQFPSKLGGELFLPVLT